VQAVNSRMMVQKQKMSKVKLIVMPERLAGRFMLEERKAVDVR